MARALLSVSWYSASGWLSATTPAPTWMSTFQAGGHGGAGDVELEV
jgi:hypothetical protein